MALGQIIAKIVWEWILAAIDKIMKYILILAKSDDIHAKVVSHFIKEKSELIPLILDTSEFPYNWTLSYSIKNDGIGYTLKTNNIRIESKDIQAVWYRRFYNPIIREVESKKIQSFCFEEAINVLDGWLDSLGDKLFNKFDIQNSLDNKLLQLKIAKELGFQVPETLISNDPEEVNTFVKSIKKPVIFKAFTGSDFQFVETRIYKEEYSNKLLNLKYAPAIFQEAIEDGIELRVTVVGKKIFCVKINPNHNGAKLDWRLDSSAKISSFKLDVIEENKILDFMTKVGLEYGALDFKLTADNQLFFFEVNVGGQYLFVEMHGKHPISESIANLLIEKAHNKVYS